MIIGFGHRKRTGKDYACHYIASEIQGCHVAGFGDKLYEVCRLLYGWMGFRDKAHYVAHPEDKTRILQPINKTVRQILVDVGTPAIRENVYIDTWIDCLMNLPYEGKHLLIADVRFPNEANVIKKYGGKVVKINNSSVPYSDDAADIALSDYKGWDAIIHNNMDHTFTEALDKEVIPWLTT